jgi:hypothetical protein
MKQWCISLLRHHRRLDPLSCVLFSSGGEPLFTCSLYRRCQWDPLSLDLGDCPNQGMGGGLGPLWPSPLDINSNGKMWSSEGTIPAEVSTLQYGRFLERSIGCRCTECVRHIRCHVVVTSVTKFSGKGKFVPCRIRRILQNSEKLGENRENRLNYS